MQVRVEGGSLVESDYRPSHPKEGSAADPAGEVRLEETPEGTRFRVRAVPGARRDGILGPHGAALKVAVRAVAEKGRANAALVEMLGAALEVGGGRVEIVAGATGRDKSVLVRGVAAAHVRERLRAAIAGSLARTQRTKHPKREGR